VEAYQQLCSCCLTFELTPTAEAGRLARVVQHKPARHTGKLACRSGSGLSEGLGGSAASDEVTLDSTAPKLMRPACRRLCFDSADIERAEMKP
jgi:hypothetical protein